MSRKYPMIGQEPAAKAIGLPPSLVAVSLGAGVQSSVMALMAAAGEIKPMPDCAIFADTGWEPKGVYRHLDWLEEQLTFPLFRVEHGNIRDALLNHVGQDRFVSIPYFVLHNDGKRGKGRRQCTREYKIEPIRKKVRELIGVGYRKRVPHHVWTEQWIGISTDEMQRMKESRDLWCVHRWPLLEKKMSRQNCIDWFKARYVDRPLVKSSCIGCPFHDNQMWRNMRDNDPESWQDAVLMDWWVRALGGSVRGLKGEVYFHRNLKPLEEAVTDPVEEQPDDPFEEECEGMCGV